MNNSTIKLMFLASQKFESGKAVRGAFLLTDSETKPNEFRCTNPIRPTSLQNILYGDTMEQYILVELIGKPLYTTISEKPNLILVKDPTFLDLRPKISTPILQLTKEEEINTAQRGNGDFQLFTSSTGKFDPIVVKTHYQFPDDKNLAKEMLGPIFNRYDLTEPFNRISVALEQVHIQKIGEV